MEKLLEMARKISDKAEVYSITTSGNSISFENSCLKDIESKILSGVSLRIMKNGIMGFAYTRNLKSREELIQNAIDSLNGGVEGLFDLPMTKGLPKINTYDPSIETFSNSQIVDECSRVCNLLSERSRGQINVKAFRTVSKMRIINSSGTDLSMNISIYGFYTELLYPYTSASLNRTYIAKTFQRVPEEYLNFLADTYYQSFKEVRAIKKKMKVLFLPETLYVLMWRLNAATNGQSIYENISPIIQKRGEKIFDEKLNIYNDPLNDLYPNARSFDDEGTPCSHFPIVENGVLKNFYFDLYFAHKLKTLPTGHGFKSSISARPAPSLSHLTLTTGDKSFSSLIQSIDYGIIVAGALGAHSGNIPNGDYSVGVSPALLIENGEIIGNVKDVMIAGNIYNTLNNISAIENKLQPCFEGRFPALLFDNINVTIKE